MSKLLIMDQTGHTTLEFDPKNDAGVAEAMAKFEALIAGGYRAAERTGPGTSRLVTGFDPVREETLMIPHVVGG